MLAIEPLISTAERMARIMLLASSSAQMVSRRRAARLIPVTRKGNDGRNGTKRRAESRKERERVRPRLRRFAHHGEQPQTDHREHRQKSRGTAVRNTAFHAILYTTRAKTGRPCAPKEKARQISRIDGLRTGSRSWTRTNDPLINRRRHPRAAVSPSAKNVRLRRPGRLRRG